MRVAVRDAFVEFTAKFEGVIAWMYLDIKGLVTTAVGNLIDPVEMAAGLPFLHKDGTPATHEEIRSEWHEVKLHQEMRVRGGGAFRAVTTLHLSIEGIHAVVLSKLNANEEILRNRFTDYESWPADAQLGLLSMAWAMGPAFHYPRFIEAARAKDFKTCATECHMDDRGNPGLRPRNVANLVLFENAATAIAQGIDPEILHWPLDIANG